MATESSLTRTASLLPLGSILCSSKHPPIVLPPDVQAFLHPAPEVSPQVPPQVPPCPPDVPPCPGCELIPTEGLAVLRPVELFSTPVITLLVPESAMLHSNSDEPSPKRPKSSAPHPRSERPAEMHRARARKLWAWYRGLDQQQFTHMGDDTISRCWTELQGINGKKVESDMSVFDSLLALQTQYLCFTGRPERS